MSRGNTHIFASPIAESVFRNIPALIIQAIFPRTACQNPFNSTSTNLPLSTPPLSSKPLPHLPLLKPQNPFKYLANKFPHHPSSINKIHLNKYVCVTLGALKRVPKAAEIKTHYILFSTD